MFSVGGGPGGRGGSTFSGGGGPGGGAGMAAGDPGAFLLVGDVGLDMAQRWREAASQCNRFESAHASPSQRGLPEPMMLCVVLLGTTFCSERQVLARLNKCLKE